MTRPADPRAMQPSRPGSTRTAPPQIPDDFWARPRMRRYLLFDASAALALLTGLLVLRVAWALRDGPQAWQALLADFAHPLYLAFHALTLASLLFVGVRFFRLFPKSQPARIGPAKSPPRPVLHAMLYVAWIAVTVALVVVLGGVWP